MIKLGHKLLTQFCIYIFLCIIFFLFKAIGILCRYRFNNSIVLQGLKDCLSLYEVDNKLFIKKYVSRTNVHRLVKTFIQLSIVSNKTYENNKNFYVLWIDSCLKPYKIIDPPNSVSKSNLMSQFRCGLLSKSNFTDINRCVI